MRSSISWLVGFACAFLAFFVILLIYSLAQPSMWLPFGFGLAFTAILSLAPRIPPTARISLGTLFGAIACFLWIASNSGTYFELRPAIHRGFEGFFLAVAVGALIAAASTARPAKGGRGPSLAPVAILMACGWLIAYFSSSHGAATPMVDWVMRVFHLNRQVADELVVVLRKTLHFSFYGMVCLTGFWASFGNGSPRKRAILAALLTTLAFASFDELRQATMPDRGPSVWDVLLDLSGGSVFLLASGCARTDVRDYQRKQRADSSTL